MPKKDWLLPCCPFGALVASGPECPECPECRLPGVYVGWGITIGEDMARYQNNYGLKPFGPHRAHADLIFAPHQIECSTCDGNSILTKAEDDTWFLCPSCAGAGIVWKIPAEQIESLRREVLDAFPSAEASRLSTSPIGTNLLPDQAIPDRLSIRIQHWKWAADYRFRMVRRSGDSKNAYVLAFQCLTIERVVGHLKEAEDWEDFQSWSYPSWSATQAKANLGPVSGSRHVQ